MSLTRGKDFFMKKILLFASALTGFAVVAQAQEAPTVKTTTVQYQVPTCSSCVTTTQVRTTYPEPTCNTCGETVVAQPVVMKRVEEKKDVQCRDNHELGIRNPLFVLKKGQASAQLAAGAYKEPKHETGKIAPAGDKEVEIGRRGWEANARLMYGITDKWSVQALAGASRHMPKPSQYRAAGAIGAVPKNDVYNAMIGTYYHLVDLCHFDAIVGIEGGWQRSEVRKGDAKRHLDGWNVSPTATIGSTWGWFTPYLTASYRFNRNETRDMKGKKDWDSENEYYLNPGVYIQPSKWYAFDLNLQKREHQGTQWNAGVDFYPYKNVVFGVMLSARHPYKNPMHMYGASAVGKIVF